MTQSTTIPHSDKTQLPNSQQVQHVLDRAAWEARVFTSLLQLQCMSTACGLSQNYPAEQEFVVTLHAFAPRGFEGCTELSALSKCLTRSGKKKKERNHAPEFAQAPSQPPSPHLISHSVSAGFNVFVDGCTRKKVSDLLIVLERTLSQHKISEHCSSHQCQTKEHTWHSHHVSSAKACTYISSCT